MPRDPFYRTRAAEISANIVTAQLRDLDPAGTVFTRIDQFADGEVIATLRTGATLRMDWDTTGQCIRQLERVEAPGLVQVLEIAA